MAERSAILPLARPRRSPNHPEQRSNGAAHADAIAWPESVWRERPNAAARPDSSGVVMTQWTGSIGRHALELQSDNPDEHHVLSMCYKRPDADLIIDGQIVWTGRGAYDPFVLTGPRESRWEAVFRSSYKTLRVYIPQSLVAECHAEIFGRLPSGTIKLVSADALHDPGMRQLAQVFRFAYASEHSLGSVFLDSLGMAFTCRMLRRYCDPTTVAERESTPISPVHFKRVTDYIEDNISLPLDLLQLSEIAGLSKMYFASQFKKALGVSPHAYIVHARVRRAQELLRQSDESIMSIALSLGFSSHSHLTTTFKKLMGHGPEQWRRQHRE